MQSFSNKSRREVLNVERLEARRLRAGMVGPLAGVDVQVAAQPYELTADLTYAHDLGMSGAGQTVAIIDSGIAYDHFALGGGLGTSYRVVGGWDFAENDADPYDDGPLGYHGTHVAGVVGSSDEQVPGVAPAVDLVALRVFGDSGHGDFDWIESALAWVHEHRDGFEHPITTVNLSIGSGVNSDAIPDWTELEDELETLANDGIFVSVAAGNGFREYGVAGLNYPAASPFVIPVSSVDESGQLSDFSQRHQRALAAPGEFINSTVPDFLYGFDGVTDDFARVSGTSMAAPFVAGASVLVREAFAKTGITDVTVAGIYDHLVNTADIISDADTNADYRRLNLRNALDAILTAPNQSLGAAAVVHSIGTIDSATVSSSGNESFEFIAAETGVLLIDGQTPDDVAAVSVLDGNRRVDSEVSTSDGQSDLRFVSVRKGQSYRMHVSTAVRRVRLQPLVSIHSDEVKVHGDHSEDDVYAAIGSSFVVAARGIRQQVSTGGRLQHDDTLASIDVEQTRRGLVVRIGTGDSIGGAFVGKIAETNGDSSQIGPVRQAESVLPLTPIEVSSFASSAVFSGHLPRSEQATDVMFAGHEADNRATIPLPVLDEMYSDAKRLRPASIDDSKLALLPSTDAEGLLVDQILGGPLVAFQVEAQYR